MLEQLLEQLFIGQGLLSACWCASPLCASRATGMHGRLWQLARLPPELI